jgi:hypothetical protein
MESSFSVRVEDRLEGASNFNVWKLRITNILQEHDLEKYVNTVVVTHYFGHLNDQLTTYVHFP